MKVLGLSPLDKDSTVTIVEDGVITYAAAEERFTRVKLQSGFPWQSLEDALDRTGTKAAEIDRVVYPFLPYDEETRLFERNGAAHHMRAVLHDFQSQPGLALCESRRQADAVVGHRKM